MAVKQRPWSPPQIVWSALAGMLVMTAIGFSWFGFGFQWYTQAGVNRTASAALVEQLATICVAQAHAGDGADMALKEFAALSKWKQTAFVESAHWATMPGSESPAKGVASECAERLRQS